MEPMLSSLFHPWKVARAERISTLALEAFRTPHQDIPPRRSRSIALLVKGSHFSKTRMLARNASAVSVQHVSKCSWQSKEQGGSVPAVPPLAVGSSLSSSILDEGSSFETHISYSFSMFGSEGLHIALAYTEACRKLMTWAAIRTAISFFKHDQCLLYFHTLF